ncbi:MAG: lipopolysaccharide biosynthesis protein [Bacteroidales bacterium]|nr:lipopolysaccharide biosynthesis protein [Candidatus Cryptobacteroides aphodequi]
MNLKSLAKDTAIYGLSSIVGRFLNYLLVILYTYTIPAESGGYGIVSNLYAWTALLLALLTFGMETTFFRFSNKADEDPERVYGTALKMVGGVAVVFLALIAFFLKPIAGALGYSLHPEYIAIFAVITALDAFQAIMFVRLRQQRRPIKFVALKLSFIFASIILNLLVFLVMPRFFGRFPALESAWQRFDYGVGFIFLINLICTALVTFGFIPELKGLKLKFDWALCRRMLAYSWPLLLLSLVGILNQVADKILYKHLVPGHEGLVQLGIYGACAKIAMIMAMLTQAFRYAYEPIVFGASKDKNNVSTLAAGMKYYIIFTVLAFLAVIVYLPLLKHIIGSSYWEGLGVVPVVMLAELFMGVYFNLSFWYKLSDQTWWGAVMSAAGAAVMIAVNVIFVPRIGYWACAWAGLAGYGTSMLLSLVIGGSKMKVPYDVRGILGFAGLGVLIYCLHSLPVWLGANLPAWLSITYGTILLALYGLAVLKSLKKHKEI